MITVEDFVRFCGRTIDGMVRAIEPLDDDQVNHQLMEGMNSPFALGTHALSAAEWWTEYVVLGHPIERDRPLEFTATGTVAELTAHCEAARMRIVELAPELAETTELHGEAVTRIPLDTEWTVGAALIHAYEELAQHLGHMEITVDMIQA